MENRVNYAVHVRLFSKRGEDDIMRRTQSTAIVECISLEDATRMVEAIEGLNSSKDAAERECTECIVTHDVNGKRVYIALINFEYICGAFK